ncbi:MAG: LytR C-terminal domain-containing protein, partial [Solirubrobacteraceae bacterium]
SATPASAPSAPAPGAGPTVPPVRKLPGGATPPAAAPRPRRTVPLGSTPASATVPSRRDEPAERERLFSGRAIIATVLAAALLVVVLLVSGVIGGGNDDKSSGATTTAGTTASTTPAGKSVPAPADTSVAVLNGTTVTGLAKQAAEALTARGYQVPTTTDAADQAQQTSQVAYAEGFEPSAKRIAKIVGVSASQVVAIDPSTQAVAGDVNVAVTMGLDKAQ